ncbi:Cytoplasmic dynein 2 heavy chain (DYNC2H1), putative [Trypanosoma equiperdum]|uniref:Dynein heavy chain, putative n=2 Tax=Trypanozoon TaxID=39700 RepID=Q38B68_TRYB2|nr:dynein heavy chain, putative [Trypanosoma brucei brucei TREU927]EAN77952.1 dynein heavy chain, putative [Trypanosoma brucei brucei TREU927]SCU65430.1 Cytoplasmic dynein 2 heavy chain (DYNC2H1), putative [Trypanosoma equiperdum]
MSISYKELIALRRAHLARQGQNAPLSPGRSELQASQVGASSETAVVRVDDVSPQLEIEGRPQETLPEWLVDEQQPTVGLSHLPWSQSVEGRYTTEEEVPRAEEPKVMVPHETIKGDLPRMEVMRRWRRRYDKYSLLELLKEKNVVADGRFSWEESEANQSLLPLHVFDNVSYEELSPSDWMSKRDETGGVVCLALPDANVCSWVRGWVTGWDEETNVLTVRLCDAGAATGDPKQTKGTVVRLHRLYVCFNAENPENFAERFAGAYRMRNLLKSVLRQQTFVDAIPTDEFQTVDPYALERVHQLCLNTPKLLQKQDLLQVTKVLNDVRSDYSHVMNRELLNHTVKNGALQELLGGAELPVDRPHVQVQKCGVHELRHNCFRSIVSSFLSNSITARSEIAIAILQRVREGNEVLMARRVFRTSKVPDEQVTLTLNAFEDVQVTSVRENAQFVREKWIPGITEFIKRICSDCDENEDVTLKVRECDYETCKVRGLMNTITLQMEDTLRWVLTNALSEFASFVEECAKYTVKVHSMFDVEVVPHPDLKRARIVPLFKVSLVDGEERNLVWSSSISDFLSMLTEVVYRCLALHTGARSVERRLFTFLFDSHTAFLSSLHDDDPACTSCLRRLTEAVERAGKPLDEYIATFGDVQELIALDVKQYIEDFKQKFPTTKGVEEEILRYNQKQKDVSEMIPRQKDLGLFQVDCTDLKKRLTWKCNQVVNSILDVMLNRANTKATFVINSFQELRDTLVKPTRTPEEVVDRQDFIKAIPEKVFDLQAVISEIQQVYAILDTFHVPFSEEDFNKKWTAISWPARLDDDIIQRQVDLEQTKRSLTLNLRKSQEAFSEKVVQLQHTVASFNRRSNVNKMNEIVGDVNNILENIRQLLETANEFNTHENLLLLEKTDYTMVRDLQSDFEPYASLWLTVHDWNVALREWQARPFPEIDAEAMEKRVMNNYHTISRCCVDPKLTELLTEIAKKTKAKIEEFQPILPFVKFLRTEGMKDRHWDQISKEIGRDIRPGKTIMTISDVKPLMTVEYEEILLRISEVASREYQIETSLRKMKEEWEKISFDVQPYKSTGCYLVTKDAVDTIQEVLDDQMLITQSLGFSPFKKMFEADIAAWEASLKRVQCVMDEWLICQKAWLYLEPIFQSEDITRQLPRETERFKKVNGNWHYLTNEAHEKKLVLDFCAIPDSLSKFKDNNDELELIQRGLNQYLASKRSAFARFYFLSDDELLTILSEARDPRKIQPHFRKLFENIMEIDMRDPGNEMFGMYSQMREYVPFDQGILPRRNIENWLSEIEHMMRISIRSQLSKGVKDCAEKGRQNLILNAPGQVAIAVSQIMWTASCESSIKEHGSLEPYMPKARENLMSLVETVRQPLSTLQRVNISGLITIEVHAKDIVEKLTEDKVDSIYAFEWISQLRSYWENNDCYLRQVEAQFQYGGEYLGNSTRLVVTPLTDRIYLTLTGAMHMFLGGAPAGPAGTGKTETVKDLAKAVAKQCVVFNCQEGMTYASMGKFFKGLAQAGAWACFDEFNRIDVEVLSVVAQQVSTLQEASRSKQFRIPFEGTEIIVDPSYSVFITMNPGYAGRTELPDNLKVLFRPVACMVPDYAMIAEIRLFSFGYSNSRTLAQKMVATFRLSSEQLSSQDHYDFGMRAVNTVISAAGLMKRECPDEEEDVLLLRALHDSNAPKFLDEDLLLFSGIISDLFPGVELPTRDYGSLLSTLKEKAVTFRVEPTDMFLKKCIQLYEMNILRHGQMLVGPTMGGKTSASRVLQAAMTKLRVELNEERYAQVCIHALNPKSITMAQLYGGFDDATGEWRDGLIGELFRIAARDTTDTKQWIYFDGPVDALWIESMNTVLDDNKKLCLISGEIIAMTPYMSCWFEVEDLAVASPATVSRAGMIYMEPLGCIGVDAFIKTWKDYRLPSSMEPYKDELEKLCSELFPLLIEFVQQQVVEYCPSVWPNLLISCFNIYEVLLEPFTPTRIAEVPEEQLTKLKAVYMHLFVFSVVWSFGATGDRESRKPFDCFLRTSLANLGVLISLPPIGCIQDYEFCVEQGRWIPWTERLPPFMAKVTANTFAEIIVPTADVVCYKFLNRLLLQKSFHTLCCGPTGTGKTVVLQQLLMHEMPKEFTPIFFTFSARTSANQTQDLIFSKFEVRRRATPQIWGAPVNKKFVILIDDMNMPVKEQYGAQPPIEILRQYMDYKGWYDRKTREFFNIVDIVFSGAMGPPGGGRTHISQRFLRHFNLIAFPEVNEGSMDRIFGSILDAYFKPFSEEVCQLLPQVLKASIAVFNTVTKSLRPTPSRSHYLFNLRDLAKVISGLIMATPETTNCAVGLLRLWIHEEMRTFKDRLITDADRQWFDQQLRKQVEERFHMRFSEVVPPERGTDGLLFADFIGKKDVANRYQEVTSPEELVAVLKKKLDEYNFVAFHKLHIVMFSYAVEHICRIARATRKPNGHVLLLGVGGSGRQSLSRIAAFINDFETFQVEITKGYSTNAWREDIKKALRRVAFQNKQVLFLFTDTQIVHEAMLEDVNNLLNSGEVPNLFEGPDLDEVFTAMKPVCIAENISLDKVGMYARFVKFCKFNLHVSLCMSPLGETFRGRLRMFPALVNCCTIDWFTAWPAQALHSVAHNYLSNMKLLTPKEVESCTELCVMIHESVEKMSERFLEETRRHAYVTPTSFLELLQTFKLILESQTAKGNITKQRLQNGMEKLRETEDAVAGLQQSLAENQPILLQKSESIKKLMEEIIVQTESAEETKQEAEKEEAAVAAKQRECASIEAEAQEQLSEALPELDRALDSLANLKSSQITEVAGYKAPTPGVVMTMQGIAILFQIKPVMRAGGPMEEKKPDYWATAKEQLLNNPNALLQRLINYDREHINERLIQAVMPLVSSEDFTPKKIAGASQACAAMCQWTHAMVKFHYVNKKVEPLRQRLAVAQEDNRVFQEKLRIAQVRLEAVAMKLERLQDDKTRAENEMQELEQVVRMTELKLARADMLIDGLGGEKKNWTNTVREIDENFKYLVGDMLAAAGQIAYVGPFTATYRSELLTQWTAELDRHKLVHHPQLSVFYTMQDPIVTQGWNVNGLPTDMLSVENALIMSNARRWPLMIDPQTQANKWIRQTYPDGLEILKPTQKDLVKRIEYAVRSGRPVLLENVGENIDATLAPLLAKQTFIEGGQEMIRLSEHPIPWNPDFKFFMTTKLPNPHYIPEVMVQVTLLNFFITPQGLEDQLLGVVVGQERKELEMRRSDLIKTNAAMRAEVANIQTTILRKMEEVKGDILDDESLIEYLKQSKTTTKEINDKVAEAEQAEIEINASRELYRPVSRHSSCLYFCCATLSNVDPMYQYSLQWFVRLFINGIESSEASDNLETRLQNLQDYFTYSFYQNISRSLFEKHKIMFSFYLCIRILQQKDAIDESEFRFLLQGPSVTFKTMPNPSPSWLTESTWLDLCYLSKKFPVFNGFEAHISRNVDFYRGIFMSPSAHKEALLPPYEKEVTPLQRMMFLRCLRPDKLMEAVQDFVSSELGERFIRPPPFDLFTSFKESSPTAPLIFILSQGADPFEDWKKFAEQNNMGKKLSDISLGQGQGPRAERMLQEGMENGTWVLLQNCHLATSWMPTLERLVEGMKYGIHSSFRLWLTSMPSPHFPATVLQNGVKITNEPPKGMRANVTRSVLSYRPDYLDTCKKSTEFKKLFFAMSFFHALIQERRKFGPLGWNIPYEYTSGDLGCCVAQIRMFLDKYEEIPYKVIKELSGNIHYGGRVTDDWDRRTLNTLLEVFVHPDVMKDGYKFSPSGTYNSIPVGSQKSYLDYIETWPMNTNPEIFGLHENADITCARNETFETLEAILSLQGEAAPKSASGQSPDEVVVELAKLIRKRVSEPFNIPDFQKKYPTMYEDSMNTVLVQEAIRFNRLTAVVRETLEALPLAIKGEVLMSRELEEAYRCLYNNQVPAQWAERAYPSLKPLGAWVDDLVMRLEMISSWYEEGHPSVYWISGFYFPQAFLTGILQNFARKMQISIDTVSYGFEWMKDDPEKITSHPKTGCYVHGVFIEGARIDRSSLKLVESMPKVLFEQAPLLWLQPIINREKPTDSVYICPLYKTLRRAGTLSTTGHSTNYVLTVEIPTSVCPKHWVKRGVAMVCALNT